MLEGALALLDDYGVRDRMLMLALVHGYKITVIGHSLGAGVAAFVATELKNSFHQKVNEYMNNPNLTLHPSVTGRHCITRVKSGTDKGGGGGEYKINVEIPGMLSVLAYAMPPVVSESLAAAICQDKLSVCVVNSFDIVPRLSKVTK
jgi:hypothetical protein